MPAPITFHSVSAIGDTDVTALPVKDIGPAIGYYTQVLGFEVAEKHSEKALLKRDAVTIGLTCNGSDPEQASCYFAVSDVAALRQELGRQRHRAVRIARGRIWRQAVSHLLRQRTLRRLLLLRGTGVTFRHGRQIAEIHCDNSPGVNAGASLRSDRNAVLSHSDLKNVLCGVHVPVKDESTARADMDAL